MRNPGSSVTIALSGTSLWTTALAPIFTLLPMVILPKTRAPTAMYTLSPMTGEPNLSPDPASPMVTFCDRLQSLPMTVPPEIVIPPKCPMYKPGPIRAERGSSIPHRIFIKPLDTK